MLDQPRQNIAEGSSYNNGFAARAMIDNLIKSEITRICKFKFLGIYNNITIFISSEILYHSINP
jgi:hypothetical protein